MLRVRVSQREHGLVPFARYAQSLTAGDQKRQVRADRQQLRQERSDRQKMLEVINQEESLNVMRGGPYLIGERQRVQLGNPNRACEDRGNQLVISDRRQRDEVRTVRIVS